MERLLGIIRSGGILMAMLVRQTVAPDFNSHESVALAATETNPWYEFVEQPLEALPTRLFPSKRKLLDAWQTLGKVRRQTPETLSALRMVLTETVLGTPTSGALLLPVQADDFRIKPTAAHPRAYRGTIAHPPKKKTPPPADLRPVLCGTGRLEWLTEADARMVSEARQPLLFRTSLSCLVRRQSEVNESDMLALYWALGLDHNPSRLAAVAYLFSLKCDLNTCLWGQFIAALPDEQWTPLLHLLIASNAYAVSIQGLPAFFAKHMTEVLEGPDVLYRSYWLLHGLTTAIAPEYLISGYRLADAYGQSYAFHAVQKSGYVPIATLLSYERHCRRADDFYGGMVLRLWEQCGLRPGLGECLERAGLTRYAPEVAWRCLRLYGTSWDNWGELSEEAADAKWQAVRPQMAALEATLQSAPPEFQEKCVWHLIEYLWQWDTPMELQANLSASFRLTERLCRPPFANKSNPCEVTTDFLAELSPALRERFLNSPDSSFRQLEKACRRENDTWLIGRGTWALTRQAGEFTVCCFEEFPVRFLKAAKLLGSLSGPVREEAVRASTRVATQQEAHLRLKALEDETMRSLTQSLPIKVETSADKHALQIQSLVTDNRRALRNLLEAHWGNQPSYQRDHPLTRRWLDKHPRLDLDVWLGGVPCEGMTEEWGQVFLEIEANPLEALKLGTYVGSCLGLGGSFAYSAAAVVLDINKQVLYARDVRRTVVGRQLVAVSEDDRLICFEVYPISAQKRLGRLFAEFDTRLGLALGLPLFDPRGEDEYEIAHILSHAWWDDQAWDLTTEGDA